MDRLFHRHALRHLDADLIERIEANGPQKREVKAKSDRKREPRAADTYRSAKRNEQRAQGWPVADVLKDRPLAKGRRVPLNRSQNWKFAASYAEARSNAPDPSRPVT